MTRRTPGTLVALLALFSLVFAACAYVPTRSLEYEPTQFDASLDERPSLLVRAFAEERPPRHYPSQFGSLFLTYVPLLPYVKIPYERLDESAQIHETARQRPFEANELFPALVARQIASDLNASKLFGAVAFGGSKADEDDFDYVLDGDLLSTEFDVYATSYMLGIAGVLVWIAPVPIGSNAAEVRADLTLTDRHGEVVWRHMLHGRRNRLFTLYNSGGAPISSRYSLEITRYPSNSEGIDRNSVWAYHASALRSGMNEAKITLQEALRAAERDQ